MGCSTSTQSTPTANVNGKAPYPQQQAQPIPQNSQHLYHQQRHQQHHQQLQHQHQQNAANQAQNQTRVQPSAPPPEDRQSPEGQNSPKTQKETNNPSTQNIMDMLKRYIELEKIIRPLEARNVVGALSLKKEALVDIDRSVTQAEAHYKASCDKVAKEKADVDQLQQPSVKAFFTDQTSFDEKLSKEQEEYLEAVTEQEVAKSQLDSLKKQKTDIQSEIDSLSKNVTDLNAHYEEQDDLLGKIFSGEYGSDLENKLEVEVDQLKDRRDRIGLAKYKWSNSKVLLQHACNQLAFTVRRWQEIPRAPINDVQGKYHMATECRNNLVAASQNIRSAQRYLSSIKFPYCEPSEIDTLDKACNNIYVDMQTTGRHQHAFQCYNVTHKRAAALLQWFNNVLENTIEKDLNQVQNEFNTKSTSLRQERLRLIKEKTGGKDLGISQGAEPSAGKQNNFEPELASFAQPEQIKGDNGQNLSTSTEEGGSTDAPPTPLPLDELAPAPSTDELFGNIEQLKKQHEEELKEFEKAQEINKARMEQGLQEKLRQRRNRRERMDQN